MLSHSAISSRALSSAAGAVTGTVTTYYNCCCVSSSSSSSRSSSSVSSSSRSLVSTTCCDCTEGPYEYYFTVSGITDGGCALCSSHLNGTFILRFGYDPGFPPPDTGCAWITDETWDDPGCGTGARYFLFELLNFMVLYVSPEPTALAEYDLHCDDWVCDGPNTLFFVTGGFECNDWPAAVVLFVL